MELDKAKKRKYAVVMWASSAIIQMPVVAECLFNISFRTCTMEIGWEGEYSSRMYISDNLCI